MTISSIGMTSMMPSLSNISKDIISQTDTDSDSALSLEEMGIDEELFSSLDSDSDGLVTQSELTSAIESKLSEYGDTMPNPEEFASILSDLGLQMPEPPEKSENDTSSMSSDFATQLMSAYDTDGDSLLSSEEVSLLTSDEFSSLDTDGDGSISIEELTSAVDEVASTGAIPPPPPAGGAGGAMMGGGSSSESEDETYDAMDTNEDGTVSRAEMEAYYGISSDENTQTSTSNQNALDNIKMLMEALKISSNGDSVDQNSFSGMLKIINAQNNNSEINSYLNKSYSSSSFSYA